MEFSHRRGLDNDHLLEPVGAELVRTYELYPVLAQHYSREAAFRREQLAEQVAAPSPAYVSLQSALFRHGLIEQVPDVLFAGTLGRARRVRTPSGVVSLHRIPPALFGGYETAADGTKVATAEKALFDLLYLSPTRSRLFASLPEMELPKAFRWAEVARWAKKIKGKSRRTFVEQKLASLKSAHIP